MEFFILILSRDPLRNLKGLGKQMLAVYYEVYNVLYVI